MKKLAAFTVILPVLILILCGCAVNPPDSTQTSIGSNSSIVPATSADTTSSAGQTTASPESSGQTTSVSTAASENTTVSPDAGDPFKGSVMFKSEKIDRYINYGAKYPNLTYEEILTHVNIGLDMSFYSEVTAITDYNNINVLVNKYRALAADYKPELVKLSSFLCYSDSSGNVKEQYLREEAASAFESMHAEAAKSNLNIVAFGTYRSYETQKTIWEYAVNSGRTLEDVDSKNARAGHSEHQSGLAIDAMINTYDVTQTGEYKWYVENAYKFGFIIRYPEGKEAITGYNYEPWHLRYVGVDIATDMHDNYSGLTYDEYYVRVIEPEE